MKASSLFLALLAMWAGRALAGGTSPSPLLAQSPPAAVQVENAWVPQPPPGADVAAAYFTLRNPGRARAVLVEVSSPVASEAMLHRTSVVAGESRMRMVERLVIPAGGTVRLTPGAVHVMLEGLRKPLLAGEEVPLVLRFASGQVIHISARVRPPGSR